MHNNKNPSEIKRDNYNDSDTDNDNISYIVRCAQLAMAFEVTATHKPGNVDRCHDYPDTTMQHFLSSAIGVYPVFEHAVAGGKIGKCIYQAVEESLKWHKGGNTHFGAFLLLIPLISAAGKMDMHVINSQPTDFSPTASELLLRETAAQLVQQTDTDDAVALYEAFNIGGVKVADMSERSTTGLDVNSPDSVDVIVENEITLFDLMQISQGYDTIAKEWVDGFRLCFSTADSIASSMKDMSFNDALSFAFLRLLASRPDTFIQTKFDHATAVLVSRKASVVLDEFMDGNKEHLKDFDLYLLESGMNPGTTADIMVGALFILLLGGMRI